MGKWLLVSLFLFTLGCTQRFERAPLDSVENSLETSGILGGENKTSRNTTASRSVVLIELLNRQGRAITFCTATLIGPHTVLSAAHCFDRRTVPGIGGFKVLFENTYETSADHEERPGLFYSVHPAYNSLAKTPQQLIYDHDVAIGVFSGTVPANFAPVDIDTNINANYSNELVYAYGFGRTKDYTGDAAENLRYSSGALYRGMLKIDPWFKETPDRYFTLDEWPAHLCQGDSGGPQFLEKNGSLKVIGVNSASFGRKLPNGVQSCLGKSQATKVAPAAEWIRKEEARLLSYH